MPEKTKCTSCSAYDTDIDKDDQDIHWCDKLESNIEIDENGYCTKCPLVY